MRSRRVGVAYGVVVDSPAVGHTSSINIIQTTINDFAQRLPRLRDIFRRRGGGKMPAERKVQQYWREREICNNICGKIS